MKSIRVGIIGCGVIGPTHAESFKAIDDVEIVWACDLHRDRAEKLAETYGAPNVTTEFSEVLADADVDGVSICTDHASHVPLVIAALDAGKHVLCEKALVANQQGLDAMMAAHASHPKQILAAISQHRFEAINRCLKGYVEEGALGTLLTAAVHVNCLRTNAYYDADEWRGTLDKEGGSVLINQAIHFIDILGWITGGVASLCGAHTNLTHHGVIETEDTAAAVLKFRNGALGTIQATCSSNLNWEHTLSLCGSEGSIELRNNEALRIAFRDKDLEQRVTDELAACRDDPGTSAGKNYYGAGHVGQVADFVAAIRDDRDPFVTAADVRHTVDIVLGIYESQKTKGWVEL